MRFSFDWSGRVCLTFCSEWADTEGSLPASSARASSVVPAKLGGGLQRVSWARCHACCPQLSWSSRSAPGHGCRCETAASKVATWRSATAGRLWREMSCCPTVSLDWERKSSFCRPFLAPGACFLVTAACAGALEAHSCIFARSTPHRVPSDGPAPVPSSWPSWSG